MIVQIEVADMLLEDNSGMAFEIDDEDTIQKIFELCRRKGKDYADFEEVVLEAVEEALKQEKAKRQVGADETQTDSV